MSTAPKIPESVPLPASLESPGDRANLLRQLVPWMRSVARSVNAGSPASSGAAVALTQPAGVDTGTWYDTGGTGGPVWVYENARQALNQTIVDNSPTLQHVVFIDPVSGNDANPGTYASPKKTRRTSLWTGSLTGLGSHYACLFRRGTTYIHTDPGAGIDIATDQHIGSYGDHADPRPILRSTASAAIPYVVGIPGPGSISDCDIDAGDVGNRSGLVLSGTGLADYHGVQARNMRITGVTNSGTSLRAGVRCVNNASNTIGLGQNVSSYPDAYDVDVVNVDVEGCGYHGFHTAGAWGKLVDGVWRSVRFTGCRALGNSTTYDGHGFSAFAMGTVRDVEIGWVLDSGTRYWCTTAQLFGGASGTGGVAGCNTVPDVAILYQRILSPFIQTWKLRKRTTGGPGALLPGEFYFDGAAQRIYIDLGYALPTSPTSGWRTDACTQRTDGILYDRCLAKGTLWPGATGVHEGHGFAADDMTSNALVMNCESINNAGAGVSLNRGENNWVIGCRLVDNALGPIAGVGNGHRIWGNIGRGAGYSENAPFGKACVLLLPPVYAFRDAEIVCGGWRLLEYTGTDPSVFLVSGNPDFSALSGVRFEDSVIAQGVGKAHGYGSGTDEGGYVLARNLLPAAEAWRMGISPNFTGF